MPELPDVDGFRRLLCQHVVGERIRGIEVRDSGVIREASSDEFIQRLVGRVFAEPVRTGKWLLAPTDGPTMLLHFGMTGSLLWDGDHSPGRYDRVLFELAAGRLIYRDQRKLRGLWLAEDAEQIGALLGRHGPDALGFTGSQLADRLQGHRRSLKALLMDQTVLAGLGNMLTDEVLWRAGVHPALRYDSLEPLERRRLDSCLQRVLRASVKAGKIPRSKTWLSSQRDAREPRCPRCRSGLQTSRLAGRTSYWCPVCQEAGSARRMLGRAAQEERLHPAG